MRSCFCTKRPKENKRKITIESLTNYVCYITRPWVVADVLGSCVDFIEYKGWYFKYRSVFTEDYKTALVIEVKYSINKLTTESENNEDCVVCTENTCESIICCNQPICKKCLINIQTHTPDNFSCPMCRKDLNSYTAEYRFTKEEVKTKSASYSME